jgi:hypothetical protein
LFVVGPPQHQKRPGRGSRRFYDRSAKPKRAIRKAVAAQLPSEFEKMTGRVALGATFYFKRPAAHYSKAKVRTLAVGQLGLWLF